MAVILIFNDSKLASVLSGTHLSTSEGLKAELTYQHEETRRSACVVAKLPCMVAKLQMPNVDPPASASPQLWNADNVMS